MDENKIINKNLLKSCLLIILFVVVLLAALITFILFSDKKGNPSNKNIGFDNLESNNIESNEEESNIDDICVLSKKMIVYLIDSKIIDDLIKNDVIYILGNKEVTIGSKTTLSVNNNNGEVISKDIVWKSSDVSIASVDQNGNVTGIREGSTDIIVTTKDGKKSSVYKIVVKIPPISKIELSSSYRNMDLLVNESFDIKSVLTIHPKNGNKKELVFSSSNENIATVSSDGIVKALKPGNTSITIKTVNGSNVIIHLRVIESNNINVNNISTSANKVMFVAHPDDETLWGSHALYHDKYLVVCVTCGQVKERVNEFSKVMRATGDDYIMLNYPDLVDGKKSEWKAEYNDINNDIGKILSSKNWDTIVTHNPDGEYNHIHHKMTSKIVTDNANHNSLYYFGRFYWNEIPNEQELYRLTDEEFEFKTKKLIPIYGTQESAIRNLKNMVHYESWITYDEWYNYEPSEE